MKIGFIADIHEDVVSLKKIIKILNDKKCDEIVCLGDIVGYGVPYYNFYDSRDANECISIIKANCKISVIGNHDLFAIRKLPEYTAGFDYPENWFNLTFDEKKKLSERKLWLYEDSELSPRLNRKSIQYLQSLNEFATAEFDEMKFFFSHFLYPDLSGSMTKAPEKASDLLEHFKFMEDNDSMIGVSGHGHIDGIAIGTPNKIKSKAFGKYKLKTNESWLVGPCVANGVRSSGFMIVDTKNMEVESRKFKKASCK